VGLQVGLKERLPRFRQKAAEIMKGTTWNQLQIQTIWVATVLLLVGCEPISQYLPPLPPIETRSSQKPSPPAPQSSATAKMEVQVRQQINQIRQKQGLSGLQNNEKLAQVARDYSRRMAEQNFFSHTSPSGDTMVQRVHSAKIFYFMLGENLFMGTNIPQPVPAAVQGWMESQGHRENILRSEYRETGIGVWRKGNTYYFTQLFMRSLEL
jgi:uncharacterized protein YkwD